MEETVQKILTPGKGLLAADESTKTITKRFAAVGLTSTPELNQKYRQMLFGTPGMEEFISGVIMYQETVAQRNEDGMEFYNSLSERNIAPGIKLDEGLTSINEGEEQLTQGLEELPTKLKEYALLQFKFSKWRGVFRMSDIFPTDAFLEENLKRMVAYAKLSQEAGIVPIVEPEILLTGNHTTTRCELIETKVLQKLFEKLKASGVDITKVILKTSMVLPGKDSGVKAAPLEVAQATIRTLKNSVPNELPGIVFLSGGQTPNEATANLNEICKAKDTLPWRVTFSFARALQEEALSVWAGRDENVEDAREAFYRRAKIISEAVYGKL